MRMHVPFVGRGGGALDPFLPKVPFALSRRGPRSVPTCTRPRLLQSSCHSLSRTRARMGRNCKFCSKSSLT
jgi:hypothetical protein